MYIYIYIYIFYMCNQFEKLSTECTEFSVLIYLKVESE